MAVDGSAAAKLRWSLLLAGADALLEVTAGQGVAKPNVDFALAALAHRLRLPPGSGEALFTIGRLAGWLAHALEEYAERTPLRLRALYTGPRPD